MSKSGLAALKGKAKSLKEAYSLIMDASISVGDQQLLLFLKVPAEHMGHALQHTDVEVAGMKVANNWPAESVKDMARALSTRRAVSQNTCSLTTAQTCEKRQNCWSCLTIGT